MDLLDGRKFMSEPMRPPRMWTHIVLDVVVEVAIVREELHIGRPNHWISASLRRPAQVLHVLEAHRRRIHSFRSRLGLVPARHAPRL